MIKEQKLETWVRGRGIDYALARTQMVEGDVDAFAEQLALRDPAETKCAVLCFRLAEERGKLWNVIGTKLYAEQVPAVAG